MAERFKFISAVHLFLLKKDKILLLRRFNTGYEDGKYSLIAGHLDGNETIINASIREAFEEAGIIINPKDLKIVHVMHRRSNDERIDFFLECRRWENEINNKEPDKCDDLSWFNINQLPENTIGYIQDAINHYKNNQYFSELGF